MKAVGDWSIKLFADSADRHEISSLSCNPLIRGFTTNPTLMRNAGVTDYQRFACSILTKISDRPISLAVFADEFKEMEQQAYTISAWGERVYVKVPITNSKGESTLPLVRRLSENDVKLNVTAMTTFRQLKHAIAALERCPAAFVSILTGRIADTGRDPLSFMAEAAAFVRCESRNVELIWASTRELLNLVQAENAGCHAITISSALLRKMGLLGRDLEEISLDTVRAFRADAIASGYKL